jgi:inner membrane protein
MSAFPWWGWAILAAFLAYAELHVPGAYLIWIALGAGLTAAFAAAAEVSLEAQLGAFAFASLLSCVGGYFVYRRRGRSGQEEPVLNRRDRLTIGAHGVVSEPLVGGRGKVRLGDSVWLAEGPDLPAGTPVAVTAVRGMTVVVEAIGAARTGAA